MNSTNMVTCSAWVPRGKAQTNPDKVTIPEDQLRQMIDETIDTLDDDEETEKIDEEKYGAIELETLEEEMKIKRVNNGKTKEVNKEVEIADSEMKDIEFEEKDEFEETYNFSAYDNEDDPGILKMGKLVMHATAKEDPYFEGVIDDDSDAEDEIILPTDNLIAACRQQGDAATLEIFVYNSERGDLYVHHDIMLPFDTPSLCMEWLNYDPREDHNAGNLLAIGNMSPVIDVWDLDIIDCLEPAFMLGKSSNKENKIPMVGHTDSVLCLAWNHEIKHILASGSADNTVIFWDLEECKMAQAITVFSDSVQTIKWNPSESHHLLTGSCDKHVRLVDCNAKAVLRTWELNGEIECAVWDTAVDNPHNCMVSTDKGTIYYLDTRQSEPIYNFQAHEASCTDFTPSSKCPGCLVTVCEDGMIRIWDVAQGKSDLVLERNSKLGVIFTASASCDDPFVFFFGGDNREKTFKVWDIRTSLSVRKRFCPRLGLPVDEDGENDDDADDDSDEEDMDDNDEDEDTVMDGLMNKFGGKHGGSGGASGSKNRGSNGHLSNNKPQGWKPRKYKKKKKGGHLDKKRT